jgi:GR25 family glycosyltransferase involved in LPS biosynthesis
MISLSQPSEKIEYMKRHGINPQWFKGLHGNTIGTMERLEYLSPFFIPIAPYSVIGCAISHMKVWEEFLLKSTSDYALILEDDIIVVEGFKNKIEDCITKNNAWEMMYLGCFGCDSSAIKVNILEIILTMLGFVHKGCRTPRVALGTHSYIISRQGASRLLAGLKGKLWFHIDFCIQWLASQGGLNRSVYLPRIAFQTSTDEVGLSSNIKSQHPLWVLEWLSRFHIDECFRASYLFGVSLLRVGSTHLNIISLIWFIFGYIGALVGLNIVCLTLLFIFMSFNNVWKGDIYNILVHFILYIVPSCFKTI